MDAFLSVEKARMNFDEKLEKCLLSLVEDCMAGRMHGDNRIISNRKVQKK